MLDYRSSNLWKTLRGLQPRSFYVGGYFTLVLLVGLLLVKDYGVAWDESLDQVNGMVSAKYVTSRFAPAWADQQSDFQDVPDMYSFSDNDHGPLLEMALSLVKLTFGITDSRAYYLLRHTSIFLLFVSGLWALYTIGRIRFRDWRLGLAVCTLLLLSPRFFAEAFYNVKDVGFLVLFTFGIYTLIRLLQHPTLGRAVVHGLATAAALDLRILALLLVSFTVGMVGLEMLFGPAGKFTPRIVLRVAAAYLAVTVVGTIAGWPYLWEAPVDHFVQAFVNLKHYRWSGQVLYMGSISFAPELPWHYGLVWILITTPVAYTLAFGMGAVTAAVALARHGLARVRTFEGRLDLLFLGWFFLPILMIIVLDSVIYDGWRHLYFVYPGFLLLALRGARALGNIRRRRPWQHFAAGLALLAGAEMVYTLVRMVRTHPHQQVYFSFLPAATVERLFERDYWGLSYRQGLQWLLQHEPTTPIRIYGPTVRLLNNNLAILTPAERARFQLAPDNHNRYFLGGFRTMNWPYPDSLGWSVYQVRAGGVQILDVRHQQ